MNYLNEDSRGNLIRQSKFGDPYAFGNRLNGKNRHQRRLKSRIASSTAEYNKIDMTKLFKEDILEVDVRVNGETDVYLVKISFDGFLNALAGYLPEDATEKDVNYRAVLRSLSDAFNHGDVKVHCTCPDFQYRGAYWSTQNGNNAGPPELRPSDITNPDDSKGAGCKHINLVLNNTFWLNRVAAVINNYIKYMQQHYAKLYADIIYPAIFEKEYEEPVQMDMFNKIADIPEDELIDDEDTIDTSNKWAKTKNQFKPGNQSGIQFTSDKEDNNQQKMFDIDSLEDEED